MVPSMPLPASLGAFNKRTTNHMRIHKFLRSLLSVSSMQVGGSQHFSKAGDVMGLEARNEPSLSQAEEVVRWH